MPLILIVDDSPTEVHVMQKALEKHGYRTAAAADGAEGVRLAREMSPDLIFMDLGMPSMSGIEATVCLRESVVTKDVPIIICTAWMAQNHREAALRFGAREVISKPVSLHQLQTMLLRYFPTPTEASQAH